MRLQKGFESHPKTLLQYLHTALTAMPIVLIRKSTEWFHDTFGCSLRGLWYETERLSCILYIVGEPYFTILAICQHAPFFTKSHTKHN
jgi:hypothetical protein